MRARLARPSPFESRVRLLLVLLALILAAANAGNFLLVRAARSGLREGEKRASSEISRRAMREAGLESLSRAIADPASIPAHYPPTRLRALATRMELLAVDIVSADGTVLSSSSPSRLGARDGHLSLLGREAAGSLRLGEETWAAPVEAEGQAAGAYYLPIRSETGTPAAFFKATRAVPALGSVERAYRIFAAAQAVGVLLVLGAALLIAQWVVRPYRLLARTAGEAPEEFRPDPASAEDPDALLASFRQVLDKMRRQDEELKRLAPTGGAPPAGAMAEFVRAIAPTMVSGVVAVDRDGRVVAINPAAERILSTAAAEAAGHPAREVLAVSKPLLGLVRQALEEGRPRSREVVTYRTASGETGHLGAAITPIPAEGGWPGGVLCLLSDLSEIGSLRERARLRESLATVGRISAGIAHEFRNSLATILGYARLVERAAGETPAGSHGRAIAREVEAMRSMVDEFLRYSRPASLSRVRVDLSRLCAQAAEEISLDASTRNLALRLEGDLPEVLADETLLRQAFVNLFRNAAESAPGRPVALTVRGSLDPKGESVRLDLTDDGPGIPEEDIERIFLPFFTTKQRGSGLGLAIAQKTILDHDGAIEVFSRPGEGTSFRIVLPCRPAATEPVAGDVTFRNGATGL